MPIGNISKSGDNFALAAAYDLAQGPYKKESGKKKPEILHKSNIFSHIYSEIGEECNYVAEIRKKIKKPVLKLSINFDKNDRHTSQERLNFTRNTLESLGVTDGLYQYMITAHHDKPHPHHHVLVNRIKLDGSVWSDSFSKAVLEVAIDKTEKKMKWDNSLARKRRFIYNDLNEKGYEFQSANTVKDLSKITANVQRNKKKGVEEKVQYIQKAVADALNKNTFDEWEELQAELAKSAIGLMTFRNTDGKVTGTSFRYNNLSVKGTKIGYRAGAIQKVLDSNKAGLDIKTGSPIVLIDQGKSACLDGREKIIRKTVDHCLRYCDSIESLGQELQKFKIKVKYELNNDGKIRGTSYHFGNYSGTGSEINLPSSELCRRLESNQAEDFNRKQNPAFHFREKNLKNNLKKIRMFRHKPDEFAKIKFSAPRKPKIVRTKFIDSNVRDKYASKYGFVLDKDVFNKITEQLADKKFKSTSELRLFIRDYGFSWVDEVLPSITRNGRSYVSEELTEELDKIRKRQKFFENLDSSCRNVPEKQLDEFFQSLPLMDRNNVLKDGRAVLHCKETNENFYAEPNVVKAVERVIIRMAYQLFESESVTDKVQLLKVLSDKNITTNNNFPNEIVYNEHKIETQSSNEFNRHYNQYLARLKYIYIIGLETVRSIQTLKQELEKAGLSLDIDKGMVMFKGYSHKTSAVLDQFVEKLQRKEFLEDAEKAFETNKDYRSIEDLTKSLHNAGISLSIIDRTLLLKNEKLSINASAKCVEIYNSIIRNSQIDAVVSKAENCISSIPATVTRDDFAKNLERFGIYMNEAKTQLLLEKNGEEIPAGPKFRDFLLQIKRREDIQSIISKADDIAASLADLTINSLDFKLGEAGITLKVQDSVLYLSKNGVTTVASSEFRSKWELIKSLEDIKAVIEKPDIEFGELKNSLNKLNVNIDRKGRELQYQSEKEAITLNKSLSEKYFTSEINSWQSFVGLCVGLVSRYSYVANLEEFFDAIDSLGLSLRLEGEDFLISDKNWQLKAADDFKEFLQKLAYPEPEIIQEAIPELVEEPEMETAPENSIESDILEIEEEPIDEDLIKLQEKIKNIYDQSGSAAGYVRDLRDSGVSLSKIDNDILFSYNGNDHKLSELFSDQLADNIYSYCSNGLSQGLGR